MSDIYYDIYMTDQIIQSDPRIRGLSERSKVYEPVFNKYGYTTDDYMASVNFYLERPDKFSKIFEKTQDMLKQRRSILEIALAKEVMMAQKWPFFDSLRMYASDSLYSNPYYRSLDMMFFRPDSVMENSPVDSVFDNYKSTRYELYGKDVFRYDTIRPLSPLLARFLLPDSLFNEAHSESEKADKMKTGRILPIPKKTPPSIRKTTSTQKSSIKKVSEELQ